MMTDHDRWSLQLKGATIKKRQQSLMILILYQKISLAFPSPNSNTVQSIPLKSSPQAPIILVFFIFPIMRQVCQCYPSTNLFSMEDCHFAHLGDRLSFPPSKRKNRRTHKKSICSAPKIPKGWQILSS